MVKYIDACAWANYVFMLSYGKQFLQQILELVMNQ